MRQRVLFPKENRYLCGMTAEQHITLSELQRQVKCALAERFMLPVWLTAEISELKVNYSGHCYMELIEKGEADGIPRAQARAVIWRSHYARLAGTFEAETGQPLAAGLKVLVKAAVDYHELYGFSLRIVDIDTSYTLGDMERQRQQTIARLKQEGVWDMNRMVRMPAVVQRVAVISSRNAAGCRDFAKEIEKSPYAFHITLFDAFMQGASAESSIIAALGEIAERSEQFDAAVIIRGGGSTSDLNCFNAYRLCAHVAQFPLPILTGIGHDKDTSVTDMVAHTALKTPTAVAVWLVERMTRVEGWLDTAALTLHDAAVTISRSHLLRIERMQGDLKGLSESYLNSRKQEIQNLRGRLSDEALHLIERQRLKLESAAQLAESRSPKHILRLGFSVVRAGGRALSSAGGVKPGDRVSIELSNGSLCATIDHGSE